MSAKRKRFTSFILDNGWNVEFPTEPAGILRLGPGKIRIDARFLERYRAEEGWYTILDSELRIADADGRPWQATASFQSGWLLYPLIDLSRKEPGRWLCKAPASWTEALKKRTLIGDAPHCYDDRFYRYVWIDNTGFCLQFKYFGVNFAVAALSADRLLVQVAEMFCCWNPLPVAGPDGTPLPVPLNRCIPTDEERMEEDDRFQESGDSGDHDEAQPLGYEINAGRVLFRNTAWEEREEPGWSELTVSRPLIFRPVRGKGKPQQAVVFRAGARPAPATPAEEATSGFVEKTLEYPGILEFLTDAGGRLLFEGSKLTCAFWLDRCPNSDREPVDVIRSRVRLTDEAGDVWESVTLFTPEFFFEKVCDMDSISMAGYESPENPWKPQPGSLLGIRALLDDHAWRYLLLWGVLVAFTAERQKLIVDVSPDEEGFSVRISGLVGRRRPVEIDHESRYLVLDPESRASELARWEQDEQLPPFCFQVSFTDLAFRNTTFAIDEGFWHQNAIPIPVVFTRVGRAEPRPGVRFVADSE